MSWEVFWTSFHGRPNSQVPVDLYVRGVRLLVGAGRIDAARLLREQLEARLDDLDTCPRPESVSLLNSLLATGHRDKAAESSG